MTLYRNNSSKEFIKDIIDNRIVDYYTGESVDFNREIPFYLQWDRRWGRENYAGGNIVLTDVALLVWLWLFPDY